MSQAKKVVNVKTAKMVASVMVPMLSLGVICLSVGVYLVNHVYTGIQ